MKIHIALLRAINLGGKNRVAMADLRKLLEALGMEDVQSLLQSGNVVFRSGAGSPARLEELLAKATAKRLGVTTDFFVRDSAQWSRVIADNPFPKEAGSDPGRLLVVFLKDVPGRAQLTALERTIKGRERVRLEGRHAYVVYPDGVGRSKLTIALIESKLETRGTGRNWNTVLKLGALAEAS